MSNRQSLVEKMVQLPAELAERLHQFAEAQHISEDDLIVKALDVLFSITQDAPVDRNAWTASSEASFSNVWNNDDDARYDNWRELYGVPAR